MTRELELLDLIAEFVQTRDLGGARSLDVIADEFGAVLRRDDPTGGEEHIPPIVTREDEMSEMDRAHDYLPTSWAD